MRIQNLGYYLTRLETAVLSDLAEMENFLSPRYRGLKPSLENTWLEKATLN